MSIVEFFRRYFIEPIYTGEGYNEYNTIVYGLLLGAGILGVERLLIRLRVRVDSKFLFSLLPFLIFASASRSLVDAGIFPKTALLITPGIFFTTAFLAISSLLITKKLFGDDFYRPFAVIGWLIAGYPLAVAIYSLPQLKPILQILLLFGASSLIFAYALSFIYADLKNPWIKAVFIGHMLDASATVVGVEYYNFFEEHVFENWLINLVGTAYVIFPLKLIVLFLIVKIIKMYVEEENRNFWYLAFFILGFSPGLRDTFTVALLGG